MRDFNLKGVEAITIRGIDYPVIAVAGPDKVLIAVDDVTHAPSGFVRGAMRLAGKPLATVGTIPVHGATLHRRAAVRA